MSIIDYDPLLRFINDNLVKKDNTSYRVEIIDDYDIARREGVVTCSVDMITRISTKVCISRDDVNDINMKKYLGIIVDNLNEKITGTPAVRNYIEIDGIKYYPKNDGE